jgi:hypothetical protein
VVHSISYRCCRLTTGILGELSDAQITRPAPELAHVVCCVPQIFAGLPKGQEEQQLERRDAKQPVEDASRHQRRSIYWRRDVHDESKGSHQNRAKALPKRFDGAATWVAITLLDLSRADSTIKLMLLHAKPTKRAVRSGFGGEIEENRQDVDSGRR